MNIIHGDCVTNLDGYNRERWPTAFFAVPPVVERVDPEPGYEGVPFLTIVGNQHKEHELDDKT